MLEETTNEKVRAIHARWLEVEPRETFHIAAFIMICKYLLFNVLAHTTFYTENLPVGVLCKYLKTSSLEFHNTHPLSLHNDDNDDRMEHGTTEPCKTV